MLIRKNVISIGPAPESENVRVFQEQQLLRRFTCAKPLDRAFLQPKAFSYETMPNQH